MVSEPTDNFRCRVDAHSANPVGDEAITFDLCYERFIHAEFMTHASFNRNASSSRAIPFEKMTKWMSRDPALPLHYGSNRPGMQSGAEVENPAGAKAYILDMMESAIGHARGLVDIGGLHKEIVNRYLEPWGWINVVASMGRPALMNFFALRMSPMAHPNMQRLAVAMARAYRDSTPTPLKAGEWHLPFTSDLPATFGTDGLIKWSVARSAWCSYKTVEGKDATFVQAVKRHDDCVNLKHATPCGHQFRARDDHGRNGGQVAGFDQYRHMIPGESVSDFDFEALLDGPYKDRDFLIQE